MSIKRELKVVTGRLRGRASTRRQSDERNGPRTKERIYRASVDLFSRQGYSSTSLRDIARAVGIEVPSLYNHFGSKQQLLYEILQFQTQELLEDLLESIEELPDHHPVRRLNKLLEALIEHHCAHHHQVYLNVELRHLTIPQVRGVVSTRDKVERLVTDAIRDAVEAGDFRPIDVSVVTKSVFRMAGGIAEWYRPRGRLSAKELAAIHIDLLLGGLSASQHVPLAVVSRRGRTNKRTAHSSPR